MKEKIAAYFVLAIGLIQYAGHFSGLAPLKGLGAALAASPLPVVFSDVNGHEPFSLNILADIVFADNSRRLITLTPKQYALLVGPYTRRHAYGHAITFAPQLPEKLWQSALKHGFCDGPVSSNLKLAAGIREITFRIASKTKGRDDAWELKADCL